MINKLGIVKNTYSFTVDVSELKTLVAVYLTIANDEAAISLNPRRQGNQMMSDLVMGMDK